MLSDSVERISKTIDFFYFTSHIVHVGNNSSDAIILSHFLYLTAIFWQKIERNIWIINLAEFAKFVFSFSVLDDETLSIKTTEAESFFV